MLHLRAIDGKLKISFIAIKNNRSANRKSQNRNPMFSNIAQNKLSGR